MLAPFRLALMTGKMAYWEGIGIVSWEWSYRTDYIRPGAIKQVPVGVRTDCIGDCGCSCKPLQPVFAPHLLYQFAHTSASPDMINATNG